MKGAPASQHARRSKGFTLIELMIVVALIAVLAMIAYPSYQAYVRRANRSEAMAKLNEVASAQERFMFSYGRYAALIEGPMTEEAETSGLQMSATTAQGDSDAAYYDLTMQIDCEGLCYTVRAEPKGPIQSVDSCGTLTLENTGGRTSEGSRCW